MIYRGVGVKKRKGVNIMLTEFIFHKLLEVLRKSRQLLPCLP